MPSLSVATAQDFVREIAAKTSDGNGRQAHAFTERENVAFRAAETKAREFLARSGHIENRDYRIDKDAIGNLLVTVYGSDTSKTVMSGSHVDSVLNGGKHDGVDGVASALAYLEHFAQSGKKGTNYTFVVFRAEESSPMTGEACLGSKVMTGMIPETRLQSVTYGPERENRKLLEDVFGPRQWNEILQERNNPWVKDGTLYLPGRPELNGSGGSRDMEIVAYDELHIEQSDVLYKGDYHAGIVTHIGGSTNRRFTLDSSHLPSTKIETYNSPRSVWNMKFLGQEAHTGGTPHNGEANKYQEGTLWHRHDALIGTCAFLRELLSHTDCDISVASISIPKETGFTTVPAIQHLMIHANNDDSERTEAIIQRVAERICRDKELQFDVEHGVESSAPMTSLDRGKLLQIIGVPLIVEEKARLISRRIHTLFGGDVRATVTDATFDDLGIRMNLNTRDINPIKRDEMLRAIQEEIGAQGIDAETLFSAKTAVTEHIPLSTHVTRVAEEEAWSLGLHALTMPCQPSHDAACMQKAGAPTGMVLENHPGPSHIPTETVGDREQADAISLHHAILDRYTDGKTTPSRRLRRLS